jgi:hypothetical protein
MSLSLTAVRELVEVPLVAPLVLFWDYHLLAKTGREWIPLYAERNT